MLVIFIIFLFGGFFVPFFGAQAQEEHVICEEEYPKIYGEEGAGGLKSRFFPNYFGLVPCGRPCDTTITPWNDMDSCNICHFVWILSRIYDVIIWTVAPILAGLFFIIGGFMFLTAGGSEQRVSKAKALFKATIIGLIIVFTAWILMNTIINSELVRDDLPGFQKVSWSEFICR